MKLPTGRAYLAMTFFIFASAAAAGEAPADPGLAPIAKESTETVKSSTPSVLKLVLAGSPKNRRGPLTFVLVAKPAHGRLEMPEPQLAGTSAAGATYTSDDGYTGADSFTWKVNDGAADSKVVTCTITVTEAPPVPQDQPTAGSVGGKPVTIPALYHGGAGYTSEIKFTQPAHGTVKLEGRAFRYEPQAGFSGADSFTWQMTHSKGGKAETTAPKSIWVLVKQEGMNDWPQWRADEWRSGCTSMSLPAELHLQWRRELPAALRPFANRGAWAYADVDFCRPVQLGKLLFVPIAASDCLAAYDTATGEQRWRVFAGGALRRPPAAATLPDGKGIVIFGSDDGWVRALNAADGSERWRFHAAPNGRMAMGFGRLCSVWPVWASPVISGGRVYFAAGYLPFQGLYVYCLDTASGELVWVNDGRVSDMWNTGAFGPLALSYDGKRIFGTVEGACRPWVVDSGTGEFLGHLGVGFRYPGLFRKGSSGWYVDGKGTFIEGGRSDRNEEDPVSISVGMRMIRPSDVAALGVTGKVASILAGDGRLFVTTAEGGLYCFGPAKPAQPVIHALPAANAAPGSDAAAAAAKAMLSREDLKQGLALVLGIKDGRLAEELALQSSLSVVAVDTDRKKLQTLRARAEAAGLGASRLAILEGRPLDFALPPYIAAIVTSEDYAATGLTEKPAGVERIFEWTRPFGGELWLPASDAEHAALAAALKATLLVEIRRVGGSTQIKRTGLPDEKLRIAPPFGVVAFGCQATLPEWLPLNNAWKGQDLYTWLPQKAQGPGHVPPEPKYSGDTGYPTPTTMSTARSIFTPMVNPLYGAIEKFPGIPSSGNDGSCSAKWNRYGDFGMTHGKMASFFDASENYWGRLFFPTGGCPGRSFMWNGVLTVLATPVPGSTCGCSPFMQHTTFSLAPVAGEENWFNYQRERTAGPVEELPVRRIGINFGAPGDRLASDDKVLWTHHPYAGRYGRCSYNYESMPEALPLVPVSYRGPARSVYHHSAQMERAGTRDRAWVAASQVVGMTGLTVHLAQPAVALRAKAAPKIDGDLADECWGGNHRLVFAVNRTVIDRDKNTGLPKPDEHCYALLRYDDQNLYVAAGVQAEFGPAPGYGPDGRRQVTVTLNSRELPGEDIVLTGGEKARQSKGLEQAAWSYASKPAAGGSFTAEMAIPWDKLAAAGLWREQLVINITVSGSSFTAQYAPLWLDAPRGEATAKRPHTVRLYFAEMDGKKPGERVFDVSLQGQAAIKGLDVVKEAGGPKRELVKEFRGVAIAGDLVLEFKPTAGEPVLSGIEILSEALGAALPANAPPVAVIEASALEGPAPLAVTFSARKSQDPDGQIVSCAWDLGDGRLARGSMVQHVFAEPGTYRVHLLVRDSRGALAPASATVKVTGGESGAFVCSVRAKGGDFASLSAWEAAVHGDLTGASGKALLFRVKDRGSVSAEDNGKAVTFAGGGTGTLRHVSLAGLAYVSGCQGTIQAGSVKCTSGHSFEIGDAGRPIVTAVAECYNDWPGGLAESVKLTGWTTDALHCPVIRAATNEGFTLKGDLDASGTQHVRVERIAVDKASTLSLGPGGSASRVKAGTIRLAEGGTAANSAAAACIAASSKNVVNNAASFYTMNIRDGRPDQPRYVRPAPSRIAFYNCTARTFDPAGQSAVEFVGCLAAPGGDGFRDAGYAEPALAFRCVSTDGSAAAWDRGDGDEANSTGQAVGFADAAAGDFHLAPADKGARGRGGPGLGADLDGRERTGPAGDAGAFSAGK